MGDEKVDRCAFDLGEPVRFATVSSSSLIFDVD
jgi:hypothetical protein